jgi:hypothetical protein
MEIQDHGLSTDWRIARIEIQSADLWGLWGLAQIKITDLITDLIRIKRFQG